jgi:hypothetical protein
MGRSTPAIVVAAEDADSEVCASTRDVEDNGSGGEGAVERSIYAAFSTEPSSGTAAIGAAGPRAMPMAS